MLVPNSLLFRIQSIIHISARFFQSRCGMDLILLVRHLQVIHQIHILYNAHFLLGCRNSAFIFAIFNKFRIIIIPLSYQDVPIIKSGRFRYQMPFTDHSSLIAISLKQFRESLLVTVKCGGIIRKSIGMTMFTGQHTGTAGTTQGVCHKTICETDPFIGYPVNIGRLHITLVIGTDRLIRMVVTHDIDYIHRFFYLFRFLFFAGRQR